MAKSPNQTGVLGERTLRGANRFTIPELEKQLRERFGVTLDDVLRKKWIDTRQQVVAKTGVGEAEAERITRDIFASVPVAMR